MQLISFDFGQLCWWSRPSRGKGRNGCRGEGWGRRGNERGEYGVRNRERKKRERGRGEDSVGRGVKGGSLNAHHCSYL